MTYKTRWQGVSFSFRMRLGFVYLLSGFVFSICSISVAHAQTSSEGASPLLLKNGASDLVEMQAEATGKVSGEAAAAFEAYAQTAVFEEEAYLILQFDEVLSQKAVDQLAGQGIQLHQYIPPRAYLAQMPANVEADRLVEEGLVGYYRPVTANKLAPPYLAAVQAQPDAYYLVRGSVTSNIDAVTLQRALNDLGHPEAVQFDARHNLFVGELKGTALLALADQPFVAAIEPYVDDFVLDNEPVDQPYVESWQTDVQSNLIRANYLKSTMPGFPGLDGEGVVVGVGDNVYQGQTHIDLQGRHTVIDPMASNNGPFNDHSVHTTGIVGGNGVRNPRFPGTANRATIYSAVSGNIFDLGLEASDPMVISSNSWNTSDRNYGRVESTGRYNINSQFIDQLLREEPSLLSLHSAGNFGHQYPDYPPNFLTLNPSYGAAKNTLVVGRYGFATGFVVAPSYGPARDGRIKPDVVASSRVYATTVNNTYGGKDGSSQSTPAVAGVAALLYQQYRQEQAGQTPEGSLIKAILLNTSDYIVQQGPTFDAGFGRVNARRAAEVIANEQYDVVEIAHGAQQNVAIQVPDAIDGKAISQLKVMLYWTDPEASPYARPALVNNLDLTVSDGGTDHLPWVLDTTATNVAVPATRGVDALNNVEQVAIDAPASGTYQAQISGTSIPFGPQRAYLVYSFVLDEMVLTYPVGGEQLFSGQHKVVYWDTDAIGGGSFIEAAAYSLDGGSNWTSFKTNSTTPRSGQTLIVPEAPLSEMLVRVERDGDTSTSAPVIISEEITLDLAAEANDQTRLSWNAVAGADSYEVLHWVDNTQWDVVASTADTSMALANDHFANRTTWVSVRAVGGSGTLRSQRSVARHFVAANTPPVAVDDLFTKPDQGSRFFIDVLQNDTDAEGDPLYITALVEGTEGESSIWDNQTIVYYPNDGFTGPDTLLYTIIDNHGGTADAQIVVMRAGATSIQDTTPLRFALSQNYPNPFNPLTTIQYDIPSQAHVTLHLYDMLGRRVQVLVDQDQRAGTHSVVLDATHLASGVYFYRLTSGDFTASRRLMLVR